MYFPMFVDMQGKKCLIAGGGRVALRKAVMMLDFGMKVAVIAPEILDEISDLNGIDIKKRCFEYTDLDGYDMVIAATDSHLLNRNISKKCLEKGIFINNVTEPEKGSFICPAYLRRKDMVAAFSSGVNNPVVAQFLKNQMASFMTEELAEYAEYLGRMRDTIKNKVPAVEMRKKVYQELLDLCIREHRTPEDGEFLKIITTNQI